MCNSEDNYELKARQSILPSSACQQSDQHEFCTWLSACTLATESGQDDFEQAAIKIRKCKTKYAFNNSFAQEPLGKNIFQGQNANKRMPTKERCNIAKLHGRN